MAQLKRSEMRIIEEALRMQQGTVSDFSNRLMAEFFEDEFRIEIYDDRYAGKGTSKANHLRSFIETENSGLVARVLRKLLDHEKTTVVAEWFEQPEDRARKQAALLELIGRMESGSDVANTEGIDRFVRDETLDELVAAIERDIAAGKPAAALGHLHTYCMKKFGHLLTVHDIEWTKAEPLQSRVVKYRKSLDVRLSTHEMTREIIKNSIAIFDKFNNVRNDWSLAHDNKLLAQAEARYVFDSVSALLRFIKAVEAGQFEE